MKRLTLLLPLALIACGPHYDPCVRPAPPCPEDRPLALCECKPFEGGGSFSPVTAGPPTVTPEPETPKPDPKPDPKPETPKPDPKPDHPKPEKPKHEHPHSKPHPKH